MKRALQIRFSIRYEYTMFTIEIWKVPNCGTAPGSTQLSFHISRIELNIIKKYSFWNDDSLTGK